MAFQILSIPIPVEVKQRKTHPLIQCIIDNKAKEFEKRVKGFNINGLYPSEIWKDDVSLLTAATVYANKEVCKFLLRKKADPNILSTNGLTALHYAANVPEVPMNIVRQLIAAKANPDGHQQQPCTPLQIAASKDRLDVFKALMEAGANHERNYGINPVLDQKVENMIINQLLARKEAAEKCKRFFSFRALVPQKTQPEVFNFCKEHFLEEDPFTHLLLFERYFYVSGPSREQYQQSSMTWLKDSKKTDIYIETVIERFEKIRDEHRILVLTSLHAVICMITEISCQTFYAIVPILIKCLVRSSTVQPSIFNHLTLSVLCVTIDKSSKQKPNTDSPDFDVLKKLCSALMPFTDSNCETEVSILTYYLFAALYEFVPELINSCALTSVPDRVLVAVDIRTDEVIKEKLKRLDRNLRSPQSSKTEDTLDDAADNLTSKKKKKKKKKNKKKDNQQETNLNKDCDTAKKSVEESDFNGDSYAGHAEDSPLKINWLSISKRWQSKLEKLANGETSGVYRLRNLTIGKSSEFEIAKGSDGTRVFLGLRDDGTEVAVKQMFKTEYQKLKNEEHFLRLPQLDNPCIVRYVDFAEDDNFGYLILQLCEYKLEEYIQHHLPEDNSQKVQVLKKLVKEVLYSLNALHSHNTKVLHRDIKPQNVLIDITGKARLADFGISRRLNLEATTCHTSPAGTKYWKARETLDEDNNSGYKRSSDIQVAGMLIYYILSCGYHPFGSGPRCETNILDGKYSLEHLEDELAKDLVKWMISHEPKDRPNVEDTLQHPFFWTDQCKVEYLKRLGNEEEMVNCRNADSGLLSDIEAITAGKSFSDWKTKLPPELVQELDGKKKSYPDHTLGLLRFIRNLHEHYSEDAKKLDLLTIFPELFENAFKFAKQKGWITRMEFLPGIQGT